MLKYMRIAYFFLMSALIISCASKPVQEPPFRAPAEAMSEYYFDFSPTAIGSCDDFFATLHETKPTTINRALENFAQRKPDFFSHYTLMYRSLSLHESSPTHPRAIVYGGDARMVLTFNGHPSQHGYERLELMCFHQPTVKFEFREVIFPQEAKAPLEDLTDSESRQPFVITAPNGKPQNDCRQCHLDPPRPNWDSYPTWPGAFGSLDDRAYHPYFKNNVASKIEAQWLTQIQGERYKVLQPPKAPFRPNLRLNRALARWNALRIVEELARNPKFTHPFQVRFAKVLLCPTEFEKREFCGQYVSLPKDMLKQKYRPELLHSLAHRLEVEHRLTSDHGSTTDQSNCMDFVSYLIGAGVPGKLANYGWDAPHLDTLKAAQIRELLEPLKIDTRAWSMVKLGGVDFSDGSGSQVSFSLETYLNEPYVQRFFPGDANLIGITHSLVSFDPMKVAKTVADDGQMKFSIRESVQDPRKYREAACNHLNQRYPSHR